MLTLKDYIHQLQFVPNYSSSSLTYLHGNAEFWYHDGYYTLVLQNESKYNPATMMYEDKLFWGNDDLTIYNSTRLDETQLYNILSLLPKVDTTNFYGLTDIIH